MSCTLQIIIERMSSLKLDLIHAFGSTCSQQYHNCVGISEEDKNEVKVIFPVGKAIAKKNEFYHDGMYIEKYEEDTDHIENVCVLPTRNHVAVAYRPHYSQVQAIKIYSLGREDPISIQIFHENEKAGSIKLIIFSPSEPKFMCVLLGEPHSKLLYIDTYKNKPLAESGFTLKDVDCISICPSNSHLICVSGGSSIRLFKVEEYTFKPLDEVKKIPKGRRITTHAWYKKKMIIAATDKCEMLILDEVRPNLFEIKEEYQNVFNQPNIDRVIVTAICPFSRGLILGSNNGKFCLWTKRQDNGVEGEEALELSRKWSTTEERASEVTNIAIGLKQDILAISLANNDIATLYINQLIPQVSDLINDLTQKQIVFQYVYKGFHNKSITGMDICQQRPLIATCSHDDSTIRVWNYKNFGCKLLRMFYFKIKEDFQSDQPLITLAFHPSGYYLAVACIDKLRFFHVLNNELRPYRELGVRNANILKFSRGGNLLAASYSIRQQVEISQIKIFNALTLQEIITLKDHTSIIKNLEFKHYDQNLLSISEEGSIIEWKLSDWSKSKQIHNREMKYKYCLYWHSRNSIVTFGMYHGKKYLEEYGCETNSVSQHQLDAEVVTMAELRIGKERGLIMALEDGKLVVFGGLQRPIIMDTKNIHIAKATNISLSPCGKYVITSGQDCLVLVFKLFHEVDGVIQEQQHNSIIVDDFLADVVLINRKEIQKVNEKQKEYTKVINSLWKKLKILMDQRNKKHQVKMVEVEVQKNRVIDDVNYRIQRLKNQVQQLQEKSSGAMETLDHNNLTKAQTIEQSFEQKINFQIEKYFQLEQELIQIKLIHQRDLEDLKQKQEEEIGRLKSDFQKKFKESESIYSDSKKESERAVGIFEDRIKQIEEEQEEEIKEILSKKHKFKLQTAVTIQELFDRQAKLKKEHAKLTDQKNEQKRRNQDRITNKNKIEKDVEEARQKLKDMNSEYNQKIDVLKVKEKRIIEFQEKILELQKKKHILSYKGTQMKKAMEPKEVQIEKLKIDLIKLKKEFEGSLQKKQKSILLMQKSEKQKQNLQKLLLEETLQTQKEIQTFDKILSDIYHCLQAYKKMGDIKIFYKEFIKLYHRYINKNDKIEHIAGSKGIDEMTRQVMHLEKSLFQMTKSNQKNVIRKNDEIFKRIKENTELVTNLNDIKKDNKEILLKIRSKKEDIEKLRAAKSSLLAQCKNVDANTYKMFLQEDYGEEKGIDKSRTAGIRGSVNKLGGLIGHKEQMQESKKGFQKIECELMSQIQFMTQKTQKIQFYIRDMKERIRKHLTQYGCSPESFIQEAQLKQLSNQA